MRLCAADQFLLLPWFFILQGGQVFFARYQKISQQLRSPDIALCGPIYKAVCFLIKVVRNRFGADAIDER
jgi:hypothetical protein